MIWLLWLRDNYEKILVVIGALALLYGAYSALKHSDTSAPQPAVPVVEVATLDTIATTATSTSTSEGIVKRKIKVRITVPPETVIGDSDMVIEITIEDSSNTSVAVETVRREERRLSESISMVRSEVVPVAKNKERIFGVIGGVGYLIPDNDVVPHVGLSLRVYDLVYLCASAGWHDEVIGIGGGALKIGELFGFKIFAGVGYTIDRQVMVNLSLGG